MQHLSFKCHQNVRVQVKTSQNKTQENIIFCVKRANENLVKNMLFVKKIIISGM